MRRNRGAVNNGGNGAPSPYLKVMDSPFVSFMPFKPFAASSSSPVAFKFNNENAGVQQLQQGASPRRSPRFTKQAANNPTAAASSSAAGASNLTLDIYRKLSGDFGSSLEEVTRTAARGAMVEGTGLRPAP